MNKTTLENMRKIKCYGMHRAFKTSLESGKEEDFTTDEMIAHLVQSECDDRQNRRIEMKIKNARERILNLNYWTLAFSMIIAILILK